MANAPSFVEHALELLGSVGPVQARRMFGGHGVYARGVMFGLLDDDELFVKTDDVSRPRFLEMGCRNWTYPGAGMEQTSYYRPPDEAHEDPDAMRPWAELGLAAALRLKAAKDAAARAKAARAKARAAKTASLDSASAARRLRSGGATGSAAKPKKAAPGKRARARR